MGPLHVLCLGGCRAGGGRNASRVVDSTTGSVQDLKGSLPWGDRS